LLSPGGFIAFHDYGYVEETTRAVDEFLRQTGGHFLESASSLAVVQKPGGRENDQRFPLRTGFRSYMRQKYGVDLSGLNSALAVREQELKQNQAVLSAIEMSRGWRMLNVLRKVRDFVRPRARQNH
jgi:hypothetical protein